MTDKQQIEDIAMELYNNQDKIDVTNPYEVADLIYNANYRQVPKNAVVLTQEEYNALLLEQKRLKEMVDRIPCGYELKDKTLKETAKEIYITGKYYYAKHSPKERQLSDFLAHIKETYGVEVDE